MPTPLARLSTLARDASGATWLGAGLTLGATAWLLAWWQAWASHAVLALWGILLMACTLGLTYWLERQHHRQRLHVESLVTEIREAYSRDQSRNKAIIDSAPDAIIVTDGQAHLLSCNAASQSIFGIDPDSVQALSLPALLPVFEHTTLQEWLHRHGFNGRSINVETQGRRVEGTEFPVSLSVSHYRVGEHQGFTLIVRDITDAKWAEYTLLLRERALDSSTNGIVISDMTLPGQPMIYVNRAFTDITGYDGDEVLGYNCRFLQGPETQQPGIEVLRQAIKEGRSASVILRNFKKDGSLFMNEVSIAPVRKADGQITHYLGIQCDVTDRLAAEEALAQRTQRLDAIFDLSPDGFLAFDRSGRVDLVNPALLRMTGLRQEELVGLDATALEALMVRHARSIERQDLSTTGQAGGDAELLHWIDGGRTLQRRTAGEAGQKVMYVRDLTHEMEVDRMKNEFLSMAAHELRTPTVSIFGFSELLTKRTFNEERRQDMLSTIHRQAKILIALITELLDLAKIESRRGADFVLRPMSLRQLVEQAWSEQMSQQAAPRPVEWRTSDDANTEALVEVDAQKMGTAIGHVISNACKYSPAGSPVEIELRPMVRHGREGHAVLVRDQGIGMSPEQQARVYERFYRADTSGNIPGTGLGMTIVKEIVQLHQGLVELESEIDRGTVVTLWLPRCAVSSHEATRLPR